MQNMGINQLANMYMGNPQPLAAKIDQDQKQAKPGQIPPDLEAAIALQKIQEMRNAAQNQQAMQAGGPQPTVVDKLRQMVQPQPQAQGQPQMQGQPQGMPPQMQAPQAAPQGLPQGMPQGAPPVPQEQTGIPQLPSNLGQHLAGGGIIAFAEGKQVPDVGQPEGNAGEEEARIGMQERLERASNQGIASAPADVTTYLRNKFNANKEELGKAAEEDYKKSIGAYDTLGVDNAIKELNLRKEQFNAPKPGINSFMEYMQQIANTGRGLGGLEAGAQGAQKLNEIQKNREAQQFDLSKQILDQEQKKLDLTRGYKKEVYGARTAAIAAAGKEAYDAAIALHKSEDDAKKLAQEAELRKAEMLNHKEISAATNKTTLAAANAPGQTERIAAKLQAIRNSNLPEAEKQIKIQQALSDISSITGSGAAGVGAERNQIMGMRTELTANQAILKDIDATDEERADARQAIKELTQAISNSRKTSKIEEPDMASKARNAPPPPPGFVKQ